MHNSFWNSFFLAFDSPLLVGWTSDFMMLLMVVSPDSMLFFSTGCSTTKRRNFLCHIWLVGWLLQTDRPFATIHTRRSQDLEREEWRFGLIHWSMAWWQLLLLPSPPSRCSQIVEEFELGRQGKRARAGGKVDMVSSFFWAWITKRDFFWEGTWTSCWIESCLESGMEAAFSLPVGT